VRAQAGASAATNVEAVVFMIVYWFVADEEPLVERCEEIVSHFSPVTYSIPYGL
jgi:hypothetical protein